LISPSLAPAGPSTVVCDTTCPYRNSDAIPRFLDIRLNRRYLNLIAPTGTRYGTPASVAVSKGVIPNYVVRFVLSSARSLVKSAGGRTCSYFDRGPSLVNRLLRRPTRKLVLPGNSNLQSTLIGAGAYARFRDIIANSGNSCTSPTYWRRERCSSRDRVAWALGWARSHYPLPSPHMAVKFWQPIYRRTMPPRPAGQPLTNMPSAIQCVGRGCATERISSASSVSNMPT
jgi:hypothetical protein